MNIAPEPIDGHPNLRTSPAQHVTNRRDFTDKFSGPYCKGEGEGAGDGGFGGVDVWRWLNGKERRLTYFPRGTRWGESCDRVDLAVAGRSLVVGEERTRRKGA